MGFFKLYKPKEYGYRYIYYDPKKEAKQERERKLAEEAGEVKDGAYKSSLHKGYLREMAQKNKPDVSKQMRKSNMRLILILALLLILFYFLVS